MCSLVYAKKTVNKYSNNYKVWWDGCFWVGAPSHPTASTVLEVGKARAGQCSLGHSSNRPHRWLYLQPDLGSGCTAPTKAAAALLAFIKAFCCIIDLCVNPWEAADAGSSNWCFNNLGLMINIMYNWYRWSHSSTLCLWKCLFWLQNPATHPWTTFVSLPDTGRNSISGL